MRELNDLFLRTIAIINTVSSFPRFIHLFPTRHFLFFKPVGFIDCARRDFYQHFRGIPDEVKADDIVVTKPVTFDDPHVAEALLRRAERFAKEDGRKAWAVLCRTRETEAEWDALIALCRDAGLSVAAPVWGKNPTQVKT